MRVFGSGPTTPIPISASPSRWWPPGKLVDAIAEYRTALRILPDTASFHDNLCVLLGRQGKLDEAIAEHRTAIRIQPDFANAHNTLGNILFKDQAGLQRGGRRISRGHSPSA